MCLNFLCYPISSLKKKGGISLKKDPENKASKKQKTLQFSTYFSTISIIIVISRKLFKLFSLNYMLVYFKAGFKIGFSSRKTLHKSFYLKTGPCDQQVVM